MSFIGYLIFRFIVWMFSFMPFGMLYKISDFTEWMLFSVFKYRKNVVIQQLRSSFPLKSEQEILKTARASYKNLADIILESIKGFTMTEAEFRKRYIFSNAELSLSNTHDTQSSIHIAAHYCNWEWGAISFPLWHRKPSLGFYKPLSNEYIEAYGKKKRGRFDLVLIPINDTANAFSKYANNGATYVFVSDQSTWSDKAHWVTFLGQDTACPPGADKYARQLRCPVFFTDIQRVHRGYYMVNHTVLTPGNESLAEGDITKRYMEQLEKIIIKCPENWLWSHKRWKKKRETN